LKIETLNQVKNAEFQRLKEDTLSGKILSGAVSLRLSDIAEEMIQKTMDMAWVDAVELYGRPFCMDEDLRPVRVAVIGYGSIGSRELNYSSDLDLVYLHDSCGLDQRTDGTNSVENKVFFDYWVQMALDLIGQLYEVDLRMRRCLMPALIHSFEDWQNYQLNKSQTWEQNAMLRSRALAGDPKLCADIEMIRKNVIAFSNRRCGDWSLRDYVYRHRELWRMESRHYPKQGHRLKQAPGGIIDINFLTQYWVLKYASDYHPFDWPSNSIGQLQILSAEKLVPHEQADMLIEAYQFFHMIILNPLDTETEFEQCTSRLNKIERLWNTVMKEETIDE
jgi:glutamate-ammonia-ligase adenylyltransferase